MSTGVFGYDLTPKCHDAKICPVCANPNLKIGIDFAFCSDCNWGEKDYNIQDCIDANASSAQSAIDSIVAYLVANACVVSLKNISMRFNNMIKFDVLLRGMERRGIIQIITTADNEQHVALLLVPSKKCDWVTARLWSSEEDEHGEAYRIPCHLSKDQLNDLREDIYKFAKDWIDDETEQTDIR